MANRWRYPLEAMKLFSIRWFLWMRVAAISFVIAAAIILTLVRVLVGALEFYHQEIEGRLSSELGAEVQFESLEADWVYFDPILRMQGLSLGPESTDRLSVDRFSIRLDGFKSIIGKAPVLRELEVIGLQAVIGPDQLGNWRVSGFPVTTRSPAVDYLKLFEQSGRLVIESLQNLGSRILPLCY